MNQKPMNNSREATSAPVRPGNQSRPGIRNLDESSHYLLQCHRIALDYGPHAAERAMDLLSNSDLIAEQMK